ncbi:diguanylate cyclase domain-containing protein [Agarivorans sp. MS3-6]|uniref:sensor domain-containing diguanylate cyclase n=1 Tax=Agarivorans sp. TSD2052 TaxID=2937286 RepID=UPI00200BE1F9|nr:sensor domain-containing diguanylate cyclase [Agarivorans sp. TSD2052]UPW17613.1 sensor domain-containing diguanylate cyclase [Agarivorans sp. TSD2052]
MLDNRTLLVVTALISLGAAVALIALWRAQSRANGAGFWALGMSCIAAGSILISGRGSIPDFISLVMANSFYVLGFLLLLRGLRVFTGRPPIVLLDFGLLPLVAALFYYFNYIEPNLNIRIAVLSAAFVVICAAIVFTLLREKNVPWRSAGVAVAIVFASFGIIHGGRGIVALLSSPGQSFMHASMSSSIVFLGGIFIIGGIAISLILLTYAVLESELRIFSQAVKQSASSIIITDSDGAIDYVNPAATEKSGYLAKELIGQNPRILQSGEMAAEDYAVLWSSISAGDTWRGEFHNRKKNGELFWEIASIAPVTTRNGKISHFVAVKEDITALKDAKKRIHHLAYHDALTGLPTRKLSMDRMESALALARRNNTMVAVLFVDLDGFKAVNDTLGHDAGDQVLKMTTERLCACVREVDTVARIGGDEFLVILSSVIERDAIAIVTERMIHAVATPFTIDSVDVCISASIGIALYPEHSDNPQQLVKLADRAMYAIKHRGKNNYAFLESSA